MRDRFDHSDHDGVQYRTDEQPDSDRTCSTLETATRVDTALYLAANRRRRDVLALLRSRAGPVPVEVVVAYATERAHTRCGASRDAILRDLLSVQLPKLLVSSLIERTDGHLQYAADGPTDRVVAAVLDAERTCRDGRPTADRPNPPDDSEGSR